MVWYNLFAILALFIGGFLLVEAFKHEKFPASLGLVLVLVIFVVSRSGSMLLYSLETGNWRERWYEYLIFAKGGMSLFGGLFLSLVSIAIFGRIAKIGFIRLLDMLAAPTAFAFAVGRLGCLAAGCCRGFPLPDGYSMPDFVPQNELFPTPLIDSAMNVAIGFILVDRRIANQGRGFKCGLFLLLYGAMRFLIEFLRTNDQIWISLTAAQLMSGLIILAGAALICHSRNTGSVRIDAKDVF